MSAICLSFSPSPSLCSASDSSSRVSVPEPSRSNAAKAARASSMVLPKTVRFAAIACFSEPRVAASSDSCFSSALRCKEISLFISRARVRSWAWACETGLEGDTGTTRAPLEPPLPATLCPVPASSLPSSCACCCLSCWFSIRSLAISALRRASTSIRRFSASSIGCLLGDADGGGGRFFFALAGDFMWAGVASSAKRSEEILRGGGSVRIDTTEASEEVRCGGGGRFVRELPPGGVPAGWAEARAIRSASDPGGNCC